MLILTECPVRLILRRQDGCRSGPASEKAEECTGGAQESGRSRARILLADDHPAMLNRVLLMLEDGYDVIGTITDARAVCPRAETLRPDLIILDISIGDCNGIEIAAQVLDRGYAGAVVFLTMHEDPDFVAAALAIGGLGYVFKSRLNLDLLPAVEAALSQKSFVSICL